MNNEMMFATLLHLGSNMWQKKDHWSETVYDEEESIYRDSLACDKEIWRKVTDFLPSCGINTVLIDMGEGVRLDCHPELAVEGSWSKEEFRAELARLRSLGLTPLPKFNMSCGHNAWLKDYAYMVGTKTYYQVLKDIIEETIALFDTPAFFHLGLEEEDYQNQKHQPVAVIRSPEKRIRDAEFLFEICRAHGVRPWIWLNPACVESYGGEEAFKAAFPKDVLISNWRYGPIKDEPIGENSLPALQLYKKLADWGYEQMPTCSTWDFHLNPKMTMKLFRDHIDMAHVRGFLTAPWHIMVPKKYYAHLNDAFVFGNAKKKIFSE